MWKEIQLRSQWDVFLPTQHYLGMVYRIRGCNSNTLMHLSLGDES